MSKKLDPKLTKWINWLEVIKGEVRELVIAKDMFQQVQKMIEDNPRLHRPSVQENVTMWHGIRATIQIHKSTAFERPRRGI
jgi:hypothetical protein